MGRKSSSDGSNLSRANIDRRTRRIATFLYNDGRFFLQRNERKIEDVRNASKISRIGSTDCSGSKFSLWNGERESIAAILRFSASATSSSSSRMFLASLKTLKIAVSQTLLLRKISQNVPRRHSSDN